MWLGVALLLFACACPEKHVEGPTPAEKPAEVTPPPAAEPAPAPVEAPPAVPAPAAEAPAPAPVPPPVAELPMKAGAPCDDRGCGGDYKCVSYYGIAGPKGPEFKTCEISCATKGSKCPSGTKCTTIADGPGKVCR